MKKCPFCGADIEDSARFCLYCMQPLTEKEQILLHEKKKPQWSIIIVAIVVALLMIAILLPDGQPEDSTPSQSQSLHSALSSKPTGSSSVPETKPSSQPATQPSSQPTTPETQPPQVTTQPPQATTKPTQVTTQPATTAPVHRHVYAMKSATKQYLQLGATCTEPATYYYSCACGAIGENTFSYGDTLEHTIVTDLGYEPTCSATGLTDGTHCSVCQTVITEQQPTKAKGHTFAEGDTPSPCQVCGTMGTQKTQAVVLLYPELPFLCNDVYNVYELTWYIDPIKVKGKTEWWLRITIKHTTSVENPPFPTLTIPGARWSHSTLDWGKTELVFMLPSPDGTYEVLVE